jgi:glycosyltransferase involved in cell wall biosynthesis
MVWLLLIPVLFYFLFIRQNYGFLRIAQPFISEASSFHKVSVIIPCRNEENNLPFILGDLESQDYDADLYEVLVIDDNSTDNTFREASAYKGIKNYKVLHNPDLGKKSAIGFGVDHASGELIITTDADCRFGRKWISAYATAYSTEHPDMIIGPVQLKERPGFFGRFMELEFLSLQGVTAGTALAKKPVMCNGANLFFKKEAYLRHSGNLHPEILSGDDIFLLHSLKKDPDAEISWLNSPDGMVTTSQAHSFFSFIKQRARWISKAGSYKDSLSIALSVVTFVTIISIVFFMIAGIFRYEFCLLFLASFFIKSIADYQLLKEITKKYKKTGLLKWFLPSQIIYPFYVLVVVFYSLVGEKSWK